MPIYAHPPLSRTPIQVNHPPFQSTTAARVHFMKMMCGYDDETLEETQKDLPRPRRDQKPHEQRDEDKRRGGDRAAGR